MAKKKPFGGYSINFKGCKDTANIGEAVRFGAHPVQAHD